MREQARQAVTVAALCVLSVAGYQVVAVGDGGPAVARASGTTSHHGLHVTGTGKVTVRPDRATISFTTAGRGATLAAAQDQASAAMVKVMAAMRAGGVSRDDMQTTDVSGGRARKHGGFGAHQSLTVTVHDAGSAGALVTAGVAAGADSSSGPEFEVGDTHGAYDQALAAAVKQARSQADAIASAAGVHITGIVSVDETNGYQPAVYAADTLSAAGAAAGLAVPTQRGTREVTASVAVVFATS